MAEVVYILCGLTGLTCAIMLLLGYARTRVRFLLWSGICFIGLTANNVLLYLDIIIIPNTDFSTWRILPAFLGLLVLVFGLIWDTVR